MVFDSSGNWKINFSLDNIKKSCLSIPELSIHKWNKVSGGKYGVMFVSENGKLIVKLQRVMEIKGLDRYNDGFYPVPVNLFKLPPKSKRKPSAGSEMDVIQEAEVTKQMGKMNICPKVISYGFCPNKKFFYILMEKKGINFIKLCDQDKKFKKDTYSHRINFKQVRDKITKIVKAGWVYKDLHSGNILLSDPPENEFFIIDFGALKKYKNLNNKLQHFLIEYLYNRVCEEITFCKKSYGKKCYNKSKYLDGNPTYEKNLDEVFKRLEHSNMNSSNNKKEIKKNKPNIKKVIKTKKRKPKIKKVKKSKKNQKK